MLTNYFSSVKRYSIVHSLLIFLILQCGVVNAVLANSELPRFLDSINVHDIYPEADRFGSPTTDPVVAPAYKNGTQIGFVFLTSDYVNTTGYSGKPIHQLIAIDMQGVIKKVLLVEHHEPIVLVGIPEKRITAVLAEYEGLDIGELVRGTQDVDIDVVSGATVTVMVMDDNILHASIKVARSFGLSGLQAEVKHKGPVATINPAINETKSWQSLIDEGSVQKLKLTVGEINKAFADTGKPLVLDFPEEGNADETFIELYAAVVSIPSIGKSLLGKNEYQNLLKKLKQGEQAIFLAG